MMPSASGPVAVLWFHKAGTEPAAKGDNMQRIKNTTINGARVSTVRIAADHFETMTFVDGDTAAEDRATTEAMALRQHAAHVVAAKTAPCPELAAYYAGSAGSSVLRSYASARTITLG
jgi:hypothetical protein